MAGLMGSALHSCDTPQSKIKLECHGFTWFCSLDCILQHFLTATILICRVQSVGYFTESLQLHLHITVHSLPSKACNVSHLYLNGL